jgi:hypothetical protein
MPLPVGAAPDIVAIPAVDPAMLLDLIPTLVLLAAALGVGAVARWQSGRPVEFGRTRMVPWTLILFVCAIAVFFAVANLLIMVGIDPGKFR